MNREIKFRAWDSLNKNMHEVYRINFKERITVDSKLFEDDTRFLTLENTVLLQYTGEKDSNDVDIYEGDIGWDAHQECFGLVKFDEGKFVYTWANVCDNLWEMKEEIEIVGNIYENPELLESQS